MPELALLAQWALAIVLSISGVAKLVDRAGTADALADFGVPSSLRWAAPLLPMCELSLAALLVVPATARWGAFGALGLLAAFSAAIALNLVRGRRPDCHCFGRLGAGPIGRATLVRNGVLMLLAGVGAYRGAAAPGDLFARVTQAVAWALTGALVVGAALAGLTWLVIELWRQQARLLLRIDALEAQEGSAAAVLAPHPGHAAPGLPVGSPAPDVIGADASGASVPLSEHWSTGRVTLLLFGDPDCSACMPLYPELASWQAAEGSRRHVVVVTRASTAPHPDLGLFTEHERSASIAYGVRGTPSAVIVDGDGRVAGPLAEGAEAVRALLADPARPVPSGAATPLRMASRPARTGSAVPDVELERLVAGAARTHPRQGGSELLLFWNERCTHCIGMAEALTQRAERLVADEPVLTFVVASADQGRAATERMAGASAVLDPEMRLSLALGVPGTPTAALVGDDRRLAAELAVGPDAVLALLDAALSPSEAPTRG